MLIEKISLFYNNKKSKSFRYKGVDNLKELFHSNSINKFNKIFGNHQLELLFIERVYNKKIHIVYGLLFLERIDIEVFDDDEFHYNKLLQLRDILFEIKEL